MALGINYVEDQRIRFLIKTMKKKHLESTLNQGRFCFNPPTVFNNDPTLSPAQKDKWDAHLTFEASHLVFAPIIKDDEEGIEYGDVGILADKATMHIITGHAKCTPQTSFRIVEAEEVLEKNGVALIRLGEAAKRIKEEFGHDAFVLILDYKELIRRISIVSPFFARRIHYGNINEEFQQFLDSTGFPQAEMFQKGIDYQWQKEFRIILPEREKPERYFLEIGAITDIAFGGNIESLEHGYLLFENDDKYSEFKKQEATLTCLEDYFYT